MSPQTADANKRKEQALSEDERRNLPIEEREAASAGDDVEAHLLPEGTEREAAISGDEREAFHGGDN